MTQYTHYAVVGRCANRYGTQFLRYVGRARKTPKRVFVMGTRSHWGELRYDPKKTDIWLFYTEKEALDFVEAANSTALKSEYDATKTAYEKASELSKEILARWTKETPPIDGGRG